MKFTSIPEIIEEIQNGRMVIVVDDEDRENEGDLVMAAETATPEAINFMVKFGRGLVCLPLTEQGIRRLDLPQMVEHNTDSLHTAFTVSIDLKEGTTTGISPQDRARTINYAVKATAKPDDFVRPGHVFPLRAREGGVLRRAGHTEAAVDLARLAGLTPAGVICEIINNDGSMARVPDLAIFAKQHNLKMCTIADLIKYRRQTEKLVTRVAEANLPTKYGSFRIIGYEDKLKDSRTHVAIIKGEVSGNEPVLVRVHSECLTGDILGSLRCDCGDQLAIALQTIEEAGRGVVVYLRQEGRGIGLASKLQAYALQDEGYDTVEANEKLGYEADLRDYGVGAQILVDLGVKKITLMTNNPRKIAGVEGHGLTVVERRPLLVEPNECNVRYLETKKAKLGHMLNLSKGSE